MLPWLLVYKRNLQNYTSISCFFCLHQYMKKMKLVCCYNRNMMLQMAEHTLIMYLQANDGVGRKISLYHSLIMPSREYLAHTKHVCVQANQFGIRVNQTAINWMLKDSVHCHLTLATFQNVRSVFRRRQEWLHCNKHSRTYIMSNPRRRESAGNSWWWMYVNICPGRLWI